MKNFKKFWNSLRCIAGEWALSEIVHVFPKATFERHAAAMAYKTYVDLLVARERELGGSDP